MRKFRLQFLPTFTGYAAYDGESVTAPDPLTVPIDDINPEDLGTDKYKGRTFTQEDVSKIMSKERSKFQSRTQQTITELENLKKAAGTTEQAKITLQARIDDLNKDLQTKESIAKEQLTKAEREREAIKTQLSSERDAWRTRFESTLLSQSLLEAAHKHKAFNDDHVIALLRPSAKVVEEVDKDQKPTGKFSVKVTQWGKDPKTGEEQELLLTPMEAVKRMTEDERSFNLFQDTLKGGLGMSNQGSQKPVDLTNIDSFEAYNKNRPQILKS